MLLQAMIIQVRGYNYMCLKMMFTNFMFFGRRHFGKSLRRIKGARVVNEHKPSNNHGITKHDDNDYYHYHDYY